MSMSNFRTESHVAQQSLRGKLRAQSSSSHVVEDFHSLVHHHPDLGNLRNNIRNSNWMDEPRDINFSNVVSSHQGLGVGNSNMFVSMPHQSVKVTGNNDPQDCGSWKNIDYNNSQLNCDGNWMMNYASEPSSRVTSNQNGQLFFGEVLSNDVKLENIMKPNNFMVCQDVQSSVTNSSNDHLSNQDNASLASTNIIYQNTLHNAVTVASLGMESMGSGSRDGFLLIPNYGNQSNFLRPENFQSWGGELACVSRKPSDQETVKQGLSLSLSTNHETEQLNSKLGVSRDIDNSKTGDHLVASSSSYQEHTGPLGPFTGYATILKSSKFLKPAQDLLEEFCRACGSKIGKVSEAINDISRETESSEYRGYKGISVDERIGNRFCETSRPDYQQKKAKLLYLQEEVCRRYKLYHQHMQMVVSSFESVAGLNGSTPYVSLALNSITKNFRWLRNTIADHLSNISKALGEDQLRSSTSGASTSKGDSNNNMSKLKSCTNAVYPKQRSSDGNFINASFLEPQHVWRPQRGLPERAIAVLRAWLFDHFLHPYPTDSDKQMLATQTGLSRNQVSNWFINARVRVWKPMVEEIHMLETKGLSETSQNSRMVGRSGRSANITESQKFDDDNQMNRFGSINPIPENYFKFSGTSSLMGVEDHGLRTETWDQDKRSRHEFPDQSLMGFSPYPRSGIEGGHVSLTLGLRHGVETGQQQHQRQQRQQMIGHDDQLGMQFGGQMIHHDFVG